MTDRLRRLAQDSPSCRKSKECKPSVSTKNRDTEGSISHSQPTLKDINWLTKQYDLTGELERSNCIPEIEYSILV